MISPSRIRELLEYNSFNGQFKWKERPDNKTWNKRFSGKKTGYLAKTHKFPFIQLCLDNKLYRAHRIAWAYHYGEWPGKEIDHINLDACDNRISNLRQADRSQNECNKKARNDNKIGIKGVYYDNFRKKFVVQIKFKNMRTLKRVSTLEEAKAVYKNLSLKMHGDFGRVL